MVSGGVPTRFSMANTLRKVEKSSSRMISSVSKEEVFLAFKSTRTESPAENTTVQLPSE